MGTIDCLVNCASIFENDDILNFNNQRWQSHFDVNLKAPAILSGEFAKQKKNIQGNIINIIDQRIFKLTPYFLSYTLSKAGLETLTKTLAMKFAPKIRVNCIAPSITQSKMAKPILDNARIAEQIPLKHAMKRVGSPEDLAETAKFLLLPNSSWITGQVIHVDGGKINIET